MCPIPGALAVPGSFFVPGQAGGALARPATTNANSRWLLRLLPPGARWGSNFPASAPATAQLSSPSALSLLSPPDRGRCRPPRHGTEGWGLCRQRGIGTGCPSGASPAQGETPKHRVSAPCVPPPLPWPCPPRCCRASGCPIPAVPLTPVLPVLLPDGFSLWFSRGLEGFGG